MTCTIAIVLLGLCGSADAWETYAAFRNDVFTDLTPPIDDAGFTHDNVFALRRRRGDTAFGGGFVDRWITSRADRHRWDELDVLAFAERTFPHDVAVEARLGPSFGGNLGGRWMQNAWHGLTGTGPTIDEGLQNLYEGDRHAGVIAGVRARGSIGDAYRAYAIADGQVAIGAGVTSIELGGGGAARLGEHVALHAELAATRYHVADPNLALPGGYGFGWQLEWRLGIDVRFSRFALGYEYRDNEGGSREPIGVVAFRSRR
jgi:hypothetical protein